MAKVYLDTNKLFDVIIRNPIATSKDLSGHQVFVSPLSYHIFYYTEEIKVPDRSMSKILSQFEIVNLDGEILKNSLDGPTSDLEDNIQLHSAATESCDYFLTNDKKLLKMKFFGKTKIVNKI